MKKKGNLFFINVLSELYLNSQKELLLGAFLSKLPGKCILSLILPATSFSPSTVSFYLLFSMKKCFQNFTRLFGSPSTVVFSY